ncbi:MAG: hypothetical protein WCW27_00700 [Patescibacteria group bacterium]|jgi:hypothetical protein
MPTPPPATEKAPEKIESRAEQPERSFETPEQIKEALAEALHALESDPTDINLAKAKETLKQAINELAEQKPELRNTLEQILINLESTSTEARANEYINTFRELGHILTTNETPATETEEQIPKEKPEKLQSTEQPQLEEAPPDEADDLGDFYDYYDDSLNQFEQKANSNSAAAVATETTDEAQKQEKAKADVLKHLYDIKQTQSVGLLQLPDEIRTLLETYINRNDRLAIQLAETPDTLVIGERRASDGRIDTSKELYTIPVPIYRQILENKFDPETRKWLEAPEHRMALPDTDAVPNTADAANNTEHSPKAIAA